MGKRVLYALGLGSIILGLACTDEPQSTPTDPQFATTSACDFRAVKSGIRDYFLTTQEKAALDTAAVMETACNAGDASRQTDAGYSVIRFLERGLTGQFAIEPKTGTAKVAATLLSNLFNKMPNTTVGTTTGTDFEPVTAAGGLLGVRGGPDDPNDLAVVSRGINPRWGIEPGYNGDGTVSDFNAMTSGRFALYGSVPVSSFTTLTSLGPKYSIHASQAVTFSPEAIVGTCYPTDTGDPNRVQHKTAPTASAENSPVLALQFPRFCNGPTVVGMQESTPTTLAGRLLRFSERLFAPTPLQAAMLLKSGGGGGISTLSDFEFVVAGSVQQRFDVPPVDATALDTITVVVRIFAVGPNDTTKVPIEGVRDSLSVVGNMGSYNLVSLTPLVQTTSETGILTFRFTLDKPGGYTLSSFAKVGGYTIPTLTSDMFHITQ